MIRLGVLGPLRIERNGAEFPVPSGRDSALVAWVVLHGRRGVSVGATIDALWPGADRRADRRSFQAALSRLRPLADGSDTPLIACAEERIWLGADATVDAAEFEEVVARGHAALTGPTPWSAEARFRAALDLWRDDAYPELADTPTGIGEAARLSELRTDAFEALAALRLNQRDVHLVGDLAAMVERHPLRERSWRLLMVALAGAGRYGEALRAFQRCREELTEVGVVPSQETRRIEQAVLSHSPIDVASLVAEEFGGGVSRPGRAGAGASVDGLAEVVQAMLFGMDAGKLLLLSGPADDSGAGLSRLVAAIEATGARVVPAQGSLADDPVRLLHTALLGPGGVAGPAGPADPAGVDFPGQGYGRLQALARAVRDEARAGPLCVVVHDVDRADPALASVVRFLADAVAGCPALLAVVAQPDATDMGEHVHRVLAELWRVADRRVALDAGPVSGPAR